MLNLVKRTSDDEEPEPPRGAIPAECHPLSDAELVQLRQFLAEFAIVRATCPMAIRLLSKR